MSLGLGIKGHWQKGGRREMGTPSLKEGEVLEEEELEACWNHRRILVERR